MATKKIKKRVSNGISQLNGNKEAKESPKLPVLEQKTVSSRQKPTEKKKWEEIGQKEASKTPNTAATIAPLVITITRHHYPALKSMMGSHAFVSADGRDLRNLLDLAYAFEEMSEETFRHHVGEAHNHFSNWLKDCFELESLSDSIKSAKKEEAHTKVIQYLLSEIMK